MRAAAIWCVVLVAACAGDDKAGNSDAATDTAATVVAPTGPKACDLVTADDLRRITGQTFAAGAVTNDYMGVSQCTFKLADGGDGVVVSLHEHGKMENYTRVEGSTPVNRLGDEAVWNPESRQLAFRQGEAVVSVSMLMTSEPIWARDVAEAALRKLGGAAQ
jgi:hypothetical protein